MILRDMQDYAGNQNEATASLAEFLDRAEVEMVRFPGRRIAGWRSHWPGFDVYKDEMEREHLFEGLHKAVACVRQFTDLKEHPPHHRQDIRIFKPQLKFISKHLPRFVFVSINKCNLSKPKTRAKAARSTMPMPHQQGFSTHSFTRALSTQIRNKATMGTSWPAE